MFILALVDEEMLDQAQEDERQCTASSERVSLAESSCRLLVGSLLLSLLTPVYPQAGAAYNLRDMKAMSKVGSHV